MADFFISEDLTPLPTYASSHNSSFDFDGLLSSPLRLYEDAAQGCGGRSWPAGMVLAKHMLRYHADLRGKQIVELGAGGGLVGLAVAAGCQVDHAVILTDQIPMLDLMKKNIALNGLESKANATVYDWGTTTSPVGSGTIDIVLAADCVYFEPSFPLLQQSLVDLIGDSTECYFCFVKRRKADMKFLKTLRQTFQIEEIYDVDREVFSRKSVFLFKVTKKKKHEA